MVWGCGHYDCLALLERIALSDRGGDPPDPLPLQTTTDDLRPTITLYLLSHHV